VIIKFDLNSDLYKKIQKLIQDGKYDDIHQFVKIAIDNQIQEESGGFGQSSEKMVHEEISISQTADELIRLEKESHDDWEELEKKLKELKSGVSDLTPEKEELIWSFYNRFLPIKIVILRLAKLISLDRPRIEIEDLQESALRFAQQISKQLRDYEDENRITRNAKLSVGLPLSEVDLKGLRKKSEIRKMTAKIDSSEKRFKNQFVGRYSKKDETFEGVCFSMGLMNVKMANNVCFVSITDLGKEFALLENPVLSELKFERSLSDSEIGFICKNILPRFPTENRLVHQVIDAISRKGELNSKQLDHIFDEHKQVLFKFYSKHPGDLTSKRKEDIIVQTRVATMGRLSELRIVNWKINRKGLSEYSLNSEKLNLLN